MINKHGLPIKGLRKASGETVNWDPRSGGYTEVFYDRETGEVWTVDQVSLGHNSWTVYHDPAVIKVHATETHLTMQEIADAIAEAVASAEEAREDRERNKAYMEGYLSRVEERARKIMADPAYIMAGSGMRPNFDEAMHLAMDEVPW